MTSIHHTSKIEIKERDIVRFWKAVDKKGDDDCWEWTMSVTKPNPSSPYRLSYGIFHICVNGKDKVIPAHRFSYELHHPELEVSPYLVRHLCNNPKCCNPRHLAAGTHQDNTNDKMAAHRQHRPAEDKNGRTLLTADQVYESLTLRYRHGWTAVKIAEHFNNLVKPSTLENTFAGKNWPRVIERWKTDNPDIAHRLLDKQRKRFKKKFFANA